MTYPIICKYVYNYYYAGKLRQKYLYAVFLGIDKQSNKKISIILEQNGKTHGKNFDKELNWTKEEIQNLQILEEEIPKKILKTTQKYLEIYKSMDILDINSVKSDYN